MPEALEAALAAGDEAGVPLHDRHLPEPERPHALGGAPPARRRDRARSTTCSCSRTIRTVSSASRARRRRRSSSSRAATNVIYASSFSKTIAPGVRVGYFVLPPELAAQIEALAVSTYISPPFLTQATVYEFVRRGNFEPNLERVNGLLKARRDAMLEALEQHMPDGRDVEPARRRLLHLARRSVRPDTASCSRRRRPAGVTFVKGTDFFVPGARRRALAAARVQLRLAGGDRRGRREARAATERLAGAGGVALAATAGSRPTKPIASAEQDQPDQRDARGREHEVDVHRLTGSRARRRSRRRRAARARSDRRRASAARPPGSRRCRPLAAGAVHAAVCSAAQSTRRRWRPATQRTRNEPRLRRRCEAPGAVEAGTSGRSSRRGGRRGRRGGSSSRCRLLSLVCS